MRVIFALILLATSTLIACGTPAAVPERVPSTPLEEWAVTVCTAAEAYQAAAATQVGSGDPATMTREDRLRIGTQVASTLAPVAAASAAAIEGYHAPTVVAAYHAALGAQLRTIAATLERQIEDARAPEADPEALALEFRNALSQGEFEVRAASANLTDEARAALRFPARCGAVIR